MLDLLLADVTAGPLAEVCILECPLVTHALKVMALKLDSGGKFC